MLSNTGQVMLSGIYFCVIALEVFFCFEGKIRKKLLVLWLSPPLLVAPLLVTTEIGQRLFFTTNIAVLLFLLLVVSDIMGVVTPLALKRTGSLCVCAAMLLFGFYGYIFAEIGEGKEERALIIEEAVKAGQKKIVLPAFPCKDYLHSPDPIDSWRIPYFKQFYGIPDDVELVFESLKQKAN